MKSFVTKLSLFLVAGIPGSFFELGGIGSLNRVIGGTVFFFWVCSLIYDGKFAKMTLFHLMCFAFITWYCISLWWSVDPGETLFRLTLLQALVLVAMLWDLLRTPKDINLALRAFVIGVYISTILVYKATLVAPDQEWEARFAGLFDPNDLALMVIMGLPLGVYLATQEKNRLFAMMGYGYPLICVYVFFATGSRGALMSCLPAVLFLLYSIPRFNKNSIPVFIFGGIGLIYLITKTDFGVNIARFADIQNSLGEGHLTGRTNLWWGGWVAYKQHPFLGVGGGAYPAAAFPFSGWGEKLVAHDTYWSTLAELGPVGFLLFFGILVTVTIGIFRHRGYLRLMWLSSMATWAIGVTALSWEFRSQTWLFFVLVICSSRAYRLERHFEQGQQEAAQTAESLPAPPLQPVGATG